MLLRRITQHVRNQNWFAVFLDFIIVVAGVFIGIQVANWSALQNDKKEFDQAIARLLAENDENLKILDNLEPITTNSISLVSEAIEVLQSCEDSDDNLAKVNVGMNMLRGTSGLHLRTETLENLTENPRLLALQNPQLRKRLKDMAFSFRVMIKDAEFSEWHPLSGRFENNSNIKLGRLEAFSNQYYNINYSKQKRRLHVAEPISEICDDNQLLKALYTWETWQRNIPVFIQQARAEIAMTQVMLKQQ